MTPQNVPPKRKDRLEALMHRLVWGMLVFSVLSAYGQQTALAQQKPRRSVTHVFQQASVTKTQWSPNAGDANSNSANNAAADKTASNTNPTGLPSTSQGTNSSQSGGTAITDLNSGIESFAQRPNVQQVQNPSGAYNFTPTGASQGQYMSANNYLGSQFNNWNNLRLQPTTIDSFQGFNRTQPLAPIPSGAYISTNTYFGPAYGSWNNLSSGSVTPNYLGGYIYQP
jgi:hypothetical protein